MQNVNDCFKFFSLTIASSRLLQSLSSFSHDLRQSKLLFLQNSLGLSATVNAYCLLSISLLFPVAMMKGGRKRETFGRIQHFVFSCFGCVRETISMQISDRSIAAVISSFLRSQKYKKSVGGCVKKVGCMIDGQSG